MRTLCLLIGGFAFNFVGFDEESTLVTTDQIVTDYVEVLDPNTGDLEVHEFTRASSVEPGEFNSLTSRESGGIRGKRVSVEPNSTGRYNYRCERDNSLTCYGVKY